MSIAYKIIPYIRMQFTALDVLDTASEILNISSRNVTDLKAKEVLEVNVT